VIIQCSLHHCVSFIGKRILSKKGVARVLINASGSVYAVFAAASGESSLLNGIDKSPVGGPFLSTIV